MIEVRDLTKRYGDVVAVDHASFSVLPGRVTGFLGPNGAGKSTTMRIILGLERPTSGSVAVSGHPYHGLVRPLQAMGALLDPSAIDGGRGAANHLLWLARSNRIDRRRVDRVLELVGLSDVAGKRIGEFSLGMNQRLGIAAALLGDPPVLMFDEPVNGLDPDGIVWLRHVMRTLAAEGRTVFLSSHLMSEMAQTADHLIVIGRGRIIADESVHDLLSGHAASVVVRAERQVELADDLIGRGATTEPGPDGALLVKGLDSAAIGGVAASRGIALTELTPRNVSLEEAFFELTSNSTQFHAGDLVGAARGG